MKRESFSFKARICKVGINPCVKVPLKITNNLQPVKGYIPVTGTINGFAFEQTLCPVKEDNYRLYVNGIMLKGSQTQLGDTPSFTIEQDHRPRTAAELPMPPAFAKRLKSEKLTAAFHALTDYRQKEILKYMNYLKTEESVNRNIGKVIAQLKK